MAIETARVIVAPCSTGHTNQMQVHHRDFPEIRGEGETAAAAAGQLVNHLTRALDSALTVWRRDTIQQAIVEVQEFIKTA
jgi:hypothetical protein